MKHSIKKIFQNLNTYLLFVMLASFLIMALTFEQQLSFDKINNLNNQKNIISKISTLNADDVELTLIQFNGAAAQLNSELNKLQDIYKYSFSEKYLVGNEVEYREALDKLNALKRIFITNAHNYYTQLKNESVQSKNKEALQSAVNELKHHIDSLVLKDVQYNQAKFNMFKYFYIFSFLIIFGATLLYRKILFSIYNDLTFLISTDTSQESYKVYTQEADAISLRMKRKSFTAENSSMMDQVTGLYNNKGLEKSYADKKGMKESFFTSVAIFEIDNFSKSKRTYSQELTQSILKKIAFTISLHEKATDVIARTDYNQFTIILVRQSKEQAFKDTDIIRQSINELKFNTPNNESVTITGAFMIKPNKIQLEEAIRLTQEILTNAKKIGNNKVLQTANTSS